VPGPDSELATVIPMDSLRSEGTDDLDSAVQEMLSETSSSAELPVFHGRNATFPSDAEATCGVFLDELSEASVEEPEDELDDLFVELIDEEDRAARSLTPSSPE
jgi:hypothetical protein